MEKIDTLAPVKIKHQSQAKFMSIQLKENARTKVIVGLSGGVDSSVTAMLLQQQGYQVEAMFMKNWEEDDTIAYCAASEDANDAQAVCDQLNIPLHKVNFAAEYWDNVFEYFLSEYKAGRTPNPDILCNKEIKFKAFLNHAVSLGADFIATGHYARLKTVNNHGDNERFLLKGLDNNKDQSYFLHALSQSQLQPALFPIGELEKTKVRELAKQAGLPTHNKKDSTGICFIGERKFNSFLQEYLPAQPGNIETEDGKIVGKHNGLMYYTIGQRKGIGLGGIKNAEEKPWFTLDKDLKRNVLIIGQGTDNPGLFKSNLSCINPTWISGSPPDFTQTNITAKIRYRQDDQACKITPSVNQIENNNLLNVAFNQPQRAITNGQSIVFYQGEICLGGAVINS